jgi:hypothetical protein
MAFLKSGVIYRGVFHIIEEKGGDSWLALKDYCWEDTRNGAKYDSTTTAYPALGMVNLRDVERIEIVYDKDSKVPPKMNYLDGNESQ